MTQTKTLRLPPYWAEAKDVISAADPILGDVITRYTATGKPEGLGERGDAFTTLVRSILGQQISVKAAESVWNKLNTAFEIDADELATADADMLRACGLSRQKVKYITGTAQAFSRGDMHVEDWPDWRDKDIKDELIKLPGIGAWTAEIFLMFHLMRPDILPAQDLGLIKSFEKHYEQPRQFMPDYAEIWRPYRTVASWYLWRALDPDW